MGCLRVLGQDAGLYDTGFGTALFGLALAVTFVLLIWRTARYANVVDADRQHAQAAMHASEASFAAMFQSLPVGVVLKRVDDGQFVDVNDSFVAWSGYPRKDLLGRTSAELGINRDDAEREATLERVRHGESLRGAESHMFTKTVSAETCSTT
jgi:PAS domain-containing protein